MAMLAMRVAVSAMPCCHSSGASGSAPYVVSVPSTVPPGSRIGAHHADRSPCCAISSRRSPSHSGSVCTSREITVALRNAAAPVAPAVASTGRRSCASPNVRGSEGAAAGRSSRWFSAISKIEHWRPVWSSTNLAIAGRYSSSRASPVSARSSRRSSATSRTSRSSPSCPPAPPCIWFAPLGPAVPEPSSRSSGMVMCTLAPGRPRLRQARTRYERRIVGSEAGCAPRRPPCLDIGIPGPMAQAVAR